MMQKPIGMMYRSASLSGVSEKATLLKRRHGVKSDVLTARTYGVSHLSIRVDTSGAHFC